MSEPRESRRDFFRALSGKSALRSLGGLFGGGRLLSHTLDGGTPEEAGLALGRRLSGSPRFGESETPACDAAKGEAQGDTDRLAREGDCETAKGGDTPSE